MHKTKSSSIGRYVLLALMLTLHSGCARTSGPKTRMTMSSAAELFSPEDKEALRAELEQLLDYSETEIKAACANIEDHTQDPSALEAALRWRINFVETANNIALDEPLVILLRTWSLAQRQKQYLERGEAKNLFRDLQPLAIDAAIRIHRRTEEVARAQIPEDRISEFIRRVERIARENPIHGVFAFELEKPLSQDERKNLVTLITGLPGQVLSGSRETLDPTSSLAKSGL